MHLKKWLNCRISGLFCSMDLSLKTYEVKKLNLDSDVLLEMFKDGQAYSLVNACALKFCAEVF